ncbi:MAG: hypothetical protein FWD97_02820 [Defluviitaleaceae bacterium]|nr:hypothetical protein [Defluviitaleaceae bacterium]
MSGTGNARPYHICVVFMIMENRQQVGAGIARPCSVDETVFGGYNVFVVENKK